jgi:hypothetical protein
MGISARSKKAINPASTLFFFTTDTAPSPPAAAGRINIQYYYAPAAPPCQWAFLKVKGRPALQKPLKPFPKAIHKVFTNRNLTFADLSDTL